MAAKKNNEAPKIVTIKELCEECGLDPKKVRAIIRTLGFNAPQTGEAGFGPKAKYQWDAEHPDLGEIRMALHKAKEPKAPKEAAAEKPVEHKAEEPVVSKSRNQKLKEAKAKAEADGNGKPDLKATTKGSK